MKRNIVFFVFLFLVLAGCSKSSSKLSDINTTGNGGTYSISGSVTSSGGSPISGVDVSLTGNSIGNSTNFAAATGSAGTFSFTKLTNGNYAVVVTRSGYTYAPDSRDALVNNGNVTLDPFIGTPISSGGGGGGGGGGTGGGGGY